MNIAQRKISRIDTSANKMFSGLLFSGVPPPAKALITKYPIKRTMQITIIIRGLMNSSILPSIQSNILLI